MIVQPNFQEGEVILIDKPLGWSSFDVVKKLRYGLKVKKIGHAGTLDPLATGLLILCTGKKTKTIEEIQSQRKEYFFKMVLGKSTPSVDLETEFNEEADYSHVNEELVRHAIKSFLGASMQVPPLFSAVKVEGKRAYEIARVGGEAVLNAKPIILYEIEVEQISLPEISVRVSCSKGTYIRSLVRDIASKIGTLAYMTELRRTKIGEYEVKDALSPMDYLSSIQKLNQ